MFEGQLLAAQLEVHHASIPAFPSQAPIALHLPPGGGGTCVGGGVGGSVGGSGACVVGSGGGGVGAWVGGAGPSVGIVPPDVVILMSAQLTKVSCGPSP